MSFLLATSMAARTRHSARTFSSRFTLSSPAEATGRRERTCTGSSRCDPLSSSSWAIIRTKNKGRSQKSCGRWRSVWLRLKRYSSYTQFLKTNQKKNLTRDSSKTRKWLVSFKSHKETKPRLIKVGMKWLLILWYLQKSCKAMDKTSESTARLSTLNQTSIKSSISQLFRTKKETSCWRTYTMKQVASLAKI